MEINQAAPKFQDVSIAPMHTVEHILNATMVKTFGCPRSRNAHIEKKKSKCDYELASCPNKEQIQAIDEKSGMNFSEYVAVLSGNTDLLDKARLEKKICISREIGRAHV